MDLIDTAIKSLCIKMQIKSQNVMRENKIYKCVQRKRIVPPSQEKTTPSNET